MIIKTSKKKAVFSKPGDVASFGLDTNAEYVKEVRIYDEEVESSSYYSCHELILRIPIDKVSAIKNGINLIEGFACREVTNLRSRSKMLYGFRGNSAQNINFAINNKELLAREELRRKMQLTGFMRLFSVDIASKLFANVKVKDVLDEKIDFSEIFETEEVISINSLSNLPLNQIKNFNRSELKNVSLASGAAASGDIGTLGSIALSRRQNIAREGISRSNFRKIFNGYLKVGIDPAKIISNSRYSSQSLSRMLTGQLQNNFSIDSSYGNENFALNFHKLVEASIPESKIKPLLKRKKILKLHDTVDIPIKITDHVIEKMGKRIFDIVIYAKDKEKRIVDYYIIKIDLNKIKNRKLLIEKCKSVVDLTSHKIMCKRSPTNKPIVKISNYTNFDANYRVLNSELKSQRYQNNYLFSPISNSLVAANSALFVLDDKSPRAISKINSHFYRMKVAYPEIEADNTFFENIRSIGTPHQNTSNPVDIYCSNDVYGKNLKVESRQNIKIFLSGIPDGTIALNVVKRNLTKKETEFQIIKNFSEVVANLPKERSLSYFDLREQQTIFLRRNQINSLREQTFTFIDNDVEQGDVYEYKALLYDDNCVTSHSTNSYVSQYQKRTKIVKVSLNNVIPDRNPSDSSSPFTVTANIKVSLETSVFDDLFSSLERNTYEAFSEEFEQIKESIKQNVSCEVNLINTSTGEKNTVNTYSNIAGKEIRVPIMIHDAHAKYAIEVVPKVATLAYIIENFMSKIENLPQLQRSFPISSFLRTLEIARSKQSKDKKILSQKKISKYTSKSIRFFGLILDPITKFNQEKDDFYFEGSTGDIAHYVVYKPTSFKTEKNLAYVNYSDLTHKKSNKKNAKYDKLGVLRMSEGGSRSLANSFYAMYAVSNGSVTFKGLLSPEGPSKDFYNFILDLDDEVGIVEVYSIAVSKNGIISSPKLITILKCNNNNVEVV